MEGTDGKIVQRKNCQGLATRCGRKARGWTSNAPGLLVSGN